MLIFAPLHLAALAAIHRRGAFDLAAADPGVTRSAVSRRLRALEDRAGVMVSRRGRPGVATQAGLRLIRHFESVVLRERQVAADLPGVQAGKVRRRIVVNAMVLRHGSRSTPIVLRHE